MGRVRGAGEWTGALRPTRATAVVVVAAATVVLLAAQAGQALASEHHICPVNRNSVKILQYEKAFLGTDSLLISVTMEAAGCINDTKFLNVLKLSQANETSQFEENLHWYEFNFINCNDYVAKIGSEIVKFQPEVLSPLCTKSLVTLSVGPNVQLGRECSGARSPRQRQIEESKAACSELQGVSYTDPSPSTKPERTSLEELLELFGKPKEYQQNPIEFGSSNDGKDLFENPKLFGYDDILQATAATPSTFNVNDNNYYGSGTSFTKRHYKENAIPIFIGIVAFTVSMCLRFCLCRGKSVVRRVTTVTVIRGRSVGPPEAPQDQQDPPPSYIDVVNQATSPQCPADEASIEPPPPAYADIVDEVQPPTYSEAEAQAAPHSREMPLADEAEAQSTHPPPDPKAVPDAKVLAPSKNVLSKYIAQQKQFAFKSLEEDD